MKTSRAGRAEANIIHKGKWPYRPRGWMTQPRAEELDTLRPSGTESFCEGRRQLVRARQIGRGGAWEAEGLGQSWVGVLKGLLILNLCSAPSYFSKPLCVSSQLSITEAETRAERLL